jgi:hypothetical protein
MTSPIEALFGAGVLPRTDFPPNSRYHGAELRSSVGADGVAIPYLARRLVPAPERFQTTGEVRVRQGERLDQLAHRLLGDAEAFWRLCDAAGAIWPEELEAEGARVRVTLPVDIATPGGGG